jgi:hypothetical protein
MSDLQPETDGRHDTIVVEGDDVDHVQPPQELDPFTPEPSPAPHARFALWIALVVLVVMLAVVLFAVVR